MSITTILIEVNKALTVTVNLIPIAIMMLTVMIKATATTSGYSAKPGASMNPEKW